MTTKKPKAATAPIAPEHLFPDQIAVLKRALTAYEERGSFLARNEVEAECADSLRAVGLLMRFGKRNYNITRDGLAIAIRLTKPEANVRGRADEVAALLPALISVIDRAASFGNAGNVTDAEIAAARRLSKILAGTY